MQEKSSAANGQPKQALQLLAAAEEREVMRRWRRQESGMDGERGLLPERPDDAVAYKLLDAAGVAMQRGDWKQGVTILKLVVKEFRHTQEAACARTVIDRLTEKGSGRG